MEIMELIGRLSGEKPVIWGDSMIGFGSYHYKSASGREGDWFRAGFAPRKQNISIYIMAGFAKFHDLMEQLGKHKTGGSCLYINKLADIDKAVLEELIQRSLDTMREQYPQ